MHLLHLANTFSVLILVGAHTVIVQITGLTSIVLRFSDISFFEA